MKKSISVIIGATFKQVRLAQGLSIQSVCRTHHISPQEYCRFEQGKPTQITLPTLCNIADVLNFRIPAHAIYF